MAGEPRFIPVSAHGELVGCFDPAQAEFLGEAGLTRFDLQQRAARVWQTLYRLRNGRCVLVERAWEEGKTSYDKGRLVGIDEALYWMVINNIRPPDEMAEMAKAHRIRVTANHEHLVAFDQERKMDVSVDVSKAKFWNLVGTFDEDYTQIKVRRELYRQPSGAWILLEEPIGVGPEQKSCRLISDDEAVELLLRSGKELPVDVVHLVKNRILGPETPPVEVGAQDNIVKEDSQKVVEAGIQQTPIGPVDTSLPPSDDTNLKEKEDGGETRAPDAVPQTGPKIEVPSSDACI